MSEDDISGMPCEDSIRVAAFWLRVFQLGVKEATDQSIKLEDKLINYKYFNSNQFRDDLDMLPTFQDNTQFNDINWWRNQIEMRYVSVFKMLKKIGVAI